MTDNSEAIRGLEELSYSVQNIMGPQSARVIDQAMLIRMTPKENIWKR